MTKNFTFLSLTTTTLTCSPKLKSRTIASGCRAIFAGDFTKNEVAELIGRWCSRASRSRIQSFTKLSKTIRTHKDGVMASIELGISNGRVEGLNTKVRSIIARCYGLHSAEATLALVMLSCGPINLQLPYERRNSST
ncbi:MAG: transposase [Actinomycetota bacterium]|nr:transposase [Actinomycetota bacterium]